MTLNDLESQFRSLFSEQLVRHENLVSEAIGNILKTPVPEEVKVLLFETQYDWYKIPIVAFAMDDASPDETYFDEPFSGFLIDGGGPELIAEDAIDQDKFYDGGIDTSDLTHELLAIWFASIWKRSGGEGFKIPAYIGAHDRDAFIDLRTGIKCTAADIWRE
ncbi:MAG: hypothetical protein ACK5OC_18875 [Pirellula sp.]|jgi:hypothetical protein